MKKNLFVASLFLVVGLVLSSCNSISSQKSVSGIIKDGAGQTISLEEAHLRNENAIALGNTVVGADGKFAFDLEFPLEKGKIYAIKANNQRKFLFIKDFDGAVVFEGNLASLEKYEHKVKNSPGTALYTSLLSQRPALLQDQSRARAELKKIEDPFLRLVAGLGILNASSAENLPEWKQLAEGFKAKFPATPDAIDIDMYVKQMEQSLTAAQPTTGSTGGIVVGSPAPDINLPDPTGKMRSLSSLRGKVVLLDFWASWCGPCRRSNPELVALYAEKKAKGFEIFSVSFDGPGDQQTAGRTAAEVAQMQEEGRKKWIGAIEADKLTWPNHVSDLRKWNAAPAKVYGVQSIPQAYVIDKQGNIAAILQPGENPRAAIEKLL
jgi:thiol-disulfide isomerase/thioredoxin